MCTAELKKLNELVSLYGLESLKDIYVEGEIDRDVLEWFTRKHSRRDVSVYTIDIVDIPDEILDRYQLPHPSNRSRVIALSYELAAEASNIKASVMCIADRDYEDFLPCVRSNPFLTFTDFNSLECYLIDMETIKKFISIGLGQLPAQADLLLSQMKDVLKNLFLIRLTNEKLAWGMKWLNTRRYISVSRDKIEFDDLRFVHSYLLKNGRARDEKDFLREIEILRDNSPGDDRLLIRGHDLVETFHLISSKLRTKRNFGDIDFFSGAFLASLEAEDLMEYSLFQKVLAL